MAIFGDFFVRDNDIMNQDIIHTIEKYGGEALSIPYSEFVKLIAGNVMRRRSVDSGRLAVAGYKAILQMLRVLEKNITGISSPSWEKQKNRARKNWKRTL